GEGNIADLPLDDAALQNLINIDIEGIFSMYVDNPKEFYDKAKAKMLEVSKESLTGIDLFIPPGEGGAPGKKPSDNLPTGPGWIVELRGHTYNKKSRDFIQDILVFNLNYKGFFGDIPVDPNEKFPDAIKGRISHAFLYQYKHDENPQPGV